MKALLDTRFGWGVSCPNLRTVCGSIASIGITGIDISESDTKKVFCDSNELDNSLVGDIAMPFPRDIREAALVKSNRYCCVCHVHAGRDAEVHHIIQEADGGSNDLENAIVLCFKCHAEAGHYNPRHPRGTKYSATELRKHRDAWWKYLENFDSRLRPSTLDLNEKHPLNLIPNDQDLKLVEKEIGTLWSNYANYPVIIEIVRFKGRLIAELVIHKNSLSPHYYELYQIANGRYVVYYNYIHRADYGCASLIGANLNSDPDSPLTLEEVQENFPELATEAGLSRIRVLDL